MGSFASEMPPKLATRNVTRSSCLALAPWHNIATIARLSFGLLSLGRLTNSCSSDLDWLTWGWFLAVYARYCLSAASALQTRSDASPQHNTKHGYIGPPFPTALRCDLCGTSNLRPLFELRPLCADELVEQLRLLQCFNLLVESVACA